MNLEQQIQMLIDQAPQDGQTPAAVRAIAPILKQVAQRLRQEEYYLLQTLDQRWQVTTLSHRTESDLSKTVLYAFARQEDAAAHAGRRSALLAAPIPVLSLLFQLLALKGVDSVIFLDTPGDQQTGVEIQRQEIESLIQTQLQRSRPQPGSRLPPDLA